MKNFILLLVFFLPFLGYAGTSVYLRGGIGYGTCNMYYLAPPQDITTNTITKLSFSPANAVLGSVTFGFQGPHLGISTGVQYSANTVNFSGYSAYSVGPAHNYSSYYSGNAKFYQLSIPVMVYGRLRVAKKLSFAPGVGIELNYNRHNVVTTNYDGGASNVQEESNANSEYKLVCFSLSLQGNLEYKISKNSLLLGGLGYRYMISDFYNDAQTTGHLHSAYIQIGFGTRIFYKA